MGGPQNFKLSEELAHVLGAAVGASRVADVRMPGINGIETIRRLRQINQRYNRPLTPEIVITGYMDTQAEREAANYGEFAYSTGTRFATRTFQGTKSTGTWVSAAGYQYNPYEGYPHNISSWE